MLKPALAIAILASCCLSLPGQTLREKAEKYLEIARAQGNDFVNVSAASGNPVLAPGSLASAFGNGLAAQTQPGMYPYQTSLGGISLQVVDSAGTARLANLLYVSPTQINYYVPQGTASGTATIHIVNGTGNVPTSTAPIQTVAPGLFTANANGMGVVAATAYSTVIPTSLATPVPVFQCGASPGSCVSVPIALGVDTPVFVTLYTTGLSGRSSDGAVAIQVGTEAIPAQSVASFDLSNPLAGIDQITFGVPLTLRGSGEVNITVSVDGQVSNAGRINIQ